MTEEQKEKIFVGSVRVHEFSDGNKVINVGLSEEHMALLAKHKDDRGWVNFSIKKSIKDPNSLYGEIYVARQQAAPVVQPEAAAPFETGMPF